LGEGEAPLFRLELRLGPRDIELLTRRDLRELLLFAQRGQLWAKMKRIVEEGERAIYHAVFVAFVVGKERAAREADIDYWALEDNDMPALKKTQEDYMRDFRALMAEVQRDVLLGKIGERVKHYIWRSELIAQQAVWRAYNRGKLALWDDEILHRRAEEQRYKYRGKFMFKTAADDRVCRLCGPMSGRMADDPFEFPEPPLHVNCRCEIVAVPTVRLATKQQRFARRFLEEG
jgi:hypothetical protein